MEVDIEGSPTDYVLTLNRDRRHLTVQQLGMVAARASEQYKREAKERQKTSTGGKSPQLMKNSSQAGVGTSRDQAGKAVGVSGWSVDSANKILRIGSKSLIKAVDAGFATIRA